MEKNKILRFILVFAAITVTAVLIFLTALCAAAGYITTKKYLFSALNRVNYAEDSVKVIEESLNYLTVPSGLPDSFFTGKIYSADVGKITEDCIEKNYDGLAFTPDTADLKSKFNGYFTEYAASGNVASDIDVKSEAVDSLAEICVQQCVSVSANQIIKYLSLYSGKVNKYAVIAAAVFALLSAVGITLLIKIGRGVFGNLYLFFAVCSSGIMSALLPIIMLAGKFVNKIDITPYTVSNLLTAYTNGALYILTAVGLILIAAAALIYLYRKNNGCGKHNQSEI